MHIFPYHLAMCSLTRSRVGLVVIFSDFWPHQALNNGQGDVTEYRAATFRIKIVSGGCGDMLVSAQEFCKKHAKLFWSSSGWVWVCKWWSHGCYFWWVWTWTAGVNQIQSKVSAFKPHYCGYKTWDSRSHLIFTITTTISMLTWLLTVAA